MKKICILLSLFVGMISLFGKPQNSNAADNSANKSYSVQAVLPDNQLDKEVSYYDLKSEPNKEQNLEIIVANTGSEKITVETELNNAYTTDGATIGYDKFNAKTYKSDNPSLSSLIVGKRKIKSAIDAGQTKTIVFKIRHPKKAFDGIILGGITTTALVDSSHSKKSRCC